MMAPKGGSPFSLGDGYWWLAHALVVDPTSMWIWAALTEFIGL